MEKINLSDNVKRRQSVSGQRALAGTRCDRLIGKNSAGEQGVRHPGLTVSYRDGLATTRQTVNDMNVEFRRILGHYPTGVSVITSMTVDNKPLGLVVGSFTSVSLNPPLVGFFVDKSSSTWPMIESTGHFCVNVLGSDQNEVCHNFSRKNSDRFLGVSYSFSTRNAPLIDGSIAHLECLVHSVSEAGDHWGVLGEVDHGITPRDYDPMIFYRGNFGGFRPTYAE